MRFNVFLHTIKNTSPNILWIYFAQKVRFAGVCREQNCTWNFPARARFQAFQVVSVEPLWCSGNLCCSRRDASSDFCVKSDFSFDSFSEFKLQCNFLTAQSWTSGATRLLYPLNLRLANVIVIATSSLSVFSDLAVYIVPCWPNCVIVRFRYSALLEVVASSSFWLRVSRFICSKMHVSSRPWIRSLMGEPLIPWRSTAQNILKLACKLQCHRSLANQLVELQLTMIHHTVTIV